MKLVTYVDAPHELDVFEVYELLHQVRTNPQIKVAYLDCTPPVAVLYTGEASFTELRAAYEARVAEINEIIKKGV